jgi:hypothetical protein
VPHARSSTLLPERLSARMVLRKCGRRMHMQGGLPYGTVVVGKAIIDLGLVNGRVVNFSKRGSLL